MSYTESDNATSSQIEGRHSIQEAYRAGSTVDKLYVQKGCQDGPVLSILREAKKAGTIVDFVPKERLDFMSETGHHQGVIAVLSAFAYSTIEDMFALAEDKGEAPFVFILDGIEDPHNLGAIIRTANLCGAHGVILPKRRSASLTATAVRASAGAIHHTPVAKVTNLVTTIEDLKQRGLWFVCADMDGDLMYKQDLTGPIGLVVGNEGSGVSRLVKEHCDYISAIPMHGDIDSLNVSVATGVLAYEILRQRLHAQ